MTGFQAPEPIPMYQVAPPPQAGAIEEPESMDGQPRGAEMPPKGVRIDQELLAMQTDAQNASQEQVENDEGEHYNWDAFDGGSLL
mmetsp:Transcript_14118/g.20537  ORF Transcript_14118/g.20537 Transcript_14118/m.20537 type:complete len:85 (-) Transcript_14118:368-622(-)